jgi:glutathione S-transferase
MLTLYIKETCPFCQRVLQMGENLQVTFDVKDVSEDESAQAELMEKGGKDQVPFLVDAEKDVSMYESNDIIEHIREHYAGSGERAENKPRVHVSGSTCVSCEG